jgi:hypothetical protein
VWWATRTHARVRVRVARMSIASCGTRCGTDRMPDYTIRPAPGRGRRTRRRRLEDKVISAKAATPPRNPAAPRRAHGPAAADETWWADVEAVWRTGVSAEIQRLERRRSEMQRRAIHLEASTPGCADLHEVSEESLARRRAAASRSARWARDRAASAALPRAQLLDACDQRQRMVRCGCGSRWVPVGCGQVTLCAGCARRSWKKQRRRVAQSLRAHTKAAQAAWRPSLGGRRPGIYLLTLTGPHDGGVGAQREALRRAWRTLTKMARAGRWWGAYVMVYECTPGVNGQGHVHIHAAVVSSWIPYAQLHAAWRKAFPGAQVLDVSPPSRANRHLKASEYLAKYVSKGVDPLEMSGQLVGKLLIANRNKRRFATSVGFWLTQPRSCELCGLHHVCLGVPRGLRAVVPGGILRAWAERKGVWLARGDPQRSLW